MYREIQLRNFSALYLPCVRDLYSGLSKLDQPQCGRLGMETTHGIQNVIHAAAGVRELYERLCGGLDRGCVRLERLSDAKGTEFERCVTEAKAKLPARSDVLCIEPLKKFKLMYHRRWLQNVLYSR